MDVRKPARLETGQIIPIKDYGFFINSLGYREPRRFLKAWDIAGPGEYSDASVGIVLDVSKPVWLVAWLERYLGLDYPILQKHIERVHFQWPGPTWIEDNAAGRSVRQNLLLPESEVLGHTTTTQSKPIMLAMLKSALQHCVVKWPECEETKVLTAEMRNYVWPDKTIRQDTVMALGIAVMHGAEAILSTGRVLKIPGGFRA
jgi:hypothetical protein